MFYQKQKRAADCRPYGHPLQGKQIGYKKSPRLCTKSVPSRGYFLFVIAYALAFLMFSINFLPVSVILA